MVAVILTKNWDKAPVVLDTANIASAEEIPGQDYGAVVHLFDAVGVSSRGVQHEVKDIPVLETAAEIAAIQSKALKDAFGSDASVAASVSRANEIGAVALAGDHKGEIYGGIYPVDNKPIWFSSAPKLMDHYAAAAWAKEQGGALPTRKQGDYLTTLKGKGGAFTEMFNRGGSFPAGYVWLAEPGTSFRNVAWCQRLSDGDQYDSFRNYELPVLCVRR